MAEKLHEIIQMLKSKFLRKNKDVQEEEDYEYYQEIQEDEIEQPITYEVQDDTDFHKEENITKASDDKLSPNAQKAVALVLIFLGMAAIGYMLNPFADKPKDTAQQGSATKQERKADMAKPASSQANELALALKKNPFIEVRAMQPESETSATAAQSTNKVSYAANTSLPAIPNNYPRPRVPMPGQTGSIPQAPAAPSGGQVTVQGILTGEDGNNMAIMSDGSVVGEGETFQDGRIAYIGGDGITFENGNRLEYK